MVGVVTAQEATVTEPTVSDETAPPDAATADTTLRDTILIIVVGAFASVALIIAHNSVPAPLLKVLLAGGDVVLDYAEGLARTTPSKSDDDTIASLKREVAELRARLEGEPPGRPGVGTE